MNGAKLAMLGAALLLGGALVMGGNAEAAAAAANIAAPAEAADFVAVKAVCTRCHGVGIFNRAPRSWNRWTEVFQRMTKRGANPTEEQVDHIVRYFLAKLTVVDINRSPADEIGPVLGVGDDVAAAIVARRQRQKFRSLAEVAAIPGVDAVLLRERKARIVF